MSRQNTNACALHTEEEEEAEVVHPQAQRWFAAVPLLRRVPLYGELSAAFGPKFATAVGASYFLSKGTGSNMIATSRQPMFVERYLVSGTRYQRLASMYSLGWSMKALIAVITDGFPLFGYSKRWYLVLSAIMGTAFTLAYALMPARESSANPAAAFVFLACFCKCSVDILTEGQYSRMMRNNPKVGSIVVSWVWACTYSGTLISAAMMGPLSDVKLTYVALIIAACFQAITVLIFAFNFFDEQPNRRDRYMDALALYTIEAASSSTTSTPSSAAMTRTSDTLDTAARNNANNDKSKPALANGDDDVGGKDGEVVKQAPQHDEDDNAAAVNAMTTATTLSPMVSKAHSSLTPYGSSDDKNVSGVTADVDFVAPEVRSCLCGAFECNEELLRHNWRLVVLCLTVTACAVTLACVSVLGTRWQLMYACITAAVVMFSGAFLALPRRLAMAVVFVFLNTATYIQFPGPLTSFYRASPSCLPGGPYFSYTFYITVAALVSDVAGIVGATCFAYLFSRRRYSFVFIITTLLQIVGSVFDLIIIKRWNLAIGIPDKVMYLFGDSVMYKICAVLSLMPAQVLMSRLCQRGAESMTFSMIAGFNNVGQSMSVAIGSLLIETRLPVRTRAPCDFSNVPWLIIIGHFCTPLIIVPLSMLMLPSARVCDNIDINGNVIPPRQPCAAHARAADYVRDTTADADDTNTRPKAKSAA